MALQSSSLFLWGYTIDATNCNIDFRAVALEAPRLAVLSFGQYSLTGLMLEVKRALQAADVNHLYTVTADRTISGGIQNRITIASSSSVFELLFSSGTHVATSASAILGFNVSDYTGAVTYTGSSTTGQSLSPTYIGYNYLPPDALPMVTGMLNLATSGIKETVVLNTQTFWMVEFRYIPEADAFNSAKWKSLIDWMITSAAIDFTPQLSNPSIVLEGTLESSVGDQKGLGFKLTEMLPSFPFNYQTGAMKFRVYPR